MSDHSAREEIHSRVGEDVLSLELALVEHHLRKDGKIGGSAEQPGVARDSAQCVCVLVVNFTA